MTINNLGKLSTHFTKEILPPPIEVVVEGGRLLQKPHLFKIDDVISIKVKDAHLEQDLDKSISRYTLDSYDESQLTIGVEFSDSNAISIDLIDADELEIEILRPDVFIGADTGYQQLEKDLPFDLQNIKITPQISQAELEFIEEAADIVKNVGVALTIWEFGMFVILGKAIKSMWILINTI